MSTAVDHETQNTQWQQAFAVHVEDVRIQHRRLDGLMKDLAATVAIGASEKAIAARFEDLVGYIQLHFSDEEEFMKRGGYPEKLREEHAEEHRAVLEWLRTISEGQSDGSPQVGADEASWLIKWLDGHQATSDPQYIDYFRECIRSEMLGQSGNAQTAAVGDQQRRSDPDM